MQDKSSPGAAAKRGRAAPPPPPSSVTAPATTARVSLALRGRARTRVSVSLSNQQLDIETRATIRQWPSVAVAAETLGVARSAIAEAASGGPGGGRLRGRAHGYLWRYQDGAITAEDENMDEALFMPKEMPRHGKNSVQQLDLETGAVIRTWPSVVAVARALGVHRQSLSMAANGERPDQMYGYRWRYGPKRHD